MALSEEGRRLLAEELEELKRRGPLVAYSIDPDANSGKAKVHLIIIGKISLELAGTLARLESRRDDIYLKVDQQKEEFYFFSDLRPGAGLLRRGGGRTGGPGGTLTCFLESIINRKVYFASAGHILSNYWSKTIVIDKSGQVNDRDGAIYVNRKGFPAVSTPRFLGKLSYLADPPLDLENVMENISTSDQVDVDIGIVEIKGDFRLRRPTCYKFAGLPSAPKGVERCQLVMKCGAEEIHWTGAVVEEPRRPWIFVYGPGNKKYVLRNQVILRSLREDDEKPPEFPNNPPKTPFGVSGDSGTMVVDKAGTPVGMLIAGSILDGRYVMTPIHALREYWTKQGFIFYRQEA